MNKYIATIQRLLLDRDRRRSHRFRAIENRACLAWSDGDETRHSVSHLVDISQEGALIVGDDPVPASGHVWLRLEAPRTTSWTSATVVRAFGERRAAIQFSKGCPFELFNAATCGNRVSGPALDAPAPTFDCLARR